MKAVAVIDTDSVPEESPTTPIEPDDILTIKEINVHENWEKGEPCPECGSEEISVMALDEDRYHSADGDYEFIRKGDAIGPGVSFICGDCLETLRHVPVESVINEL